MAQVADQNEWEVVTPGAVVARGAASAPKTSAADDDEWETVNAPQTMAAGSYQTKPGGEIKNANVKQPVTLGQRVGNAARWAEDQLPAAGMVVGGILGSAEPGGGNIAGAALGGAGGEALRRAIKSKPLNKEAAVDIGTAAAQGAASEMGGQIFGKGVEIAAPAIKNALTPATAKTAARLYERGVVPAGLSAEDQALMRENFDRAAKYIAPETRGFPIKQGEGGTMRSAGIAHRAADNLWQTTVEPVADLFKDVQRPGEGIAKSIRDGFTELDKQTKPAAVKAGEQLAQFFERGPISVGEMKDMVTQLNNDKAVARFYDMSPNEQVAAELGDPALRGKVAALHALREQMFDAIGESGGERLGQQFREGRKDWGALRSIEDQVRGARVPTPMPWWTKAANTLRGSLSPKGTDFWLRGSDTLFDFNNPDRLVPKSFNTLGRTGLKAPGVDIVPMTRGLLGTGSVVTPPRGSPSGPVDLGPVDIQPLAENRQLPGAGRTTGPRTVSGPSQYGISLPEETPRPLTGTEKQLPAAASPSDTSLPMERGGRGPNQIPPPIQLGPVPETTPPKPTNGRGGVAIAKPAGTSIPKVEDLEEAFRSKGRSGVDSYNLAKQTIQEATSGEVPEGVRTQALERIKRVMGPDTRAAGEPLAVGKNEPLAPGTEVLHHFPNPEHGTEAVVAKTSQGYSAVLRDTDSGNTLPQARIFKTEQEAIDYGKSLAKGTSPKYGKPVELGKPTEPAKPLNGKQVQLAKMEDRPAPERTARTRAPIEKLENFDEDTLANAKAELEEANGKWQTFERPGRYVHDVNFEPGDLTHKPDVQAYGVPSARPDLEAAHPWLKNLPKMTAGKLQAAIESGKGVEYTRLLNEAGRHVQAAKLRNGPIIEEYGDRLEEAAKSAESVDPDLARTLRDIKAGKFSALGNLRTYVERTLKDADSAAAFDKALGELSQEELRESAPESSGRGNQPRETNQQAVKLGPPVLPGMEQAVEENKASAAVELGKKLTQKINEPRSIESAAGEMESKSPLFRGTGASPQNEMFQPGGAAKPQEIVESAGAKFVGVQKMYGTRPDQVLFQATDGGSTLAVDADKVTPEAIRKKIAESGK